MRYLSVWEHIVTVTNVGYGVEKQDTTLWRLQPLTEASGEPNITAVGGLFVS
jgi:hypothetical protein